MSSSEISSTGHLRKIFKKVKLGHARSKSGDFVVQEPEWRKWVDLIILCIGNFINYMDRYTLAGILVDIQHYFEIKNDKAGLIQTIYVIVYMLAAPIYGYLGDRYNRKLLLAFGIIVWNAANVGCSFMTKFWAFLLFRGVFGIGQACYTTIAPSIISDLFVGGTRSKMLAVFYLAIPMGSGIGYIVGAQMTEQFSSWPWSLRATPFLSIVVLVITIVFLRDPKRGHVEGKTDLKTTPWIEDMIYLLHIRSFMLSTMGFTAVAFSSGAISWWAPKLILMGFKLKGSNVNAHTEGSIYGFIAAAAGLLGLSLGYMVTFKLKPKYPQIDPLVCALGVFISGPIFIGTSYAATYNEIVCYGLLFLGLSMIDLNCAIICDILLYVVVPIRRSSAIGLQLLMGHGFGDAGSPYLLGLLSDVLYDHLNNNKTISEDDCVNSFKALQYSFLVACAIEFLGGFFLLINTFYIVADMEQVIRGY